MYESSNAISYKLQQLSGWLYDGRQGYSLGFLLRKLEDVNLDHCISIGKPVWFARIWDTSDDDLVTFADRADTPEDAACLLAIKLYEEGILK